MGVCPEESFIFREKLRWVFSESLEKKVFDSFKDVKNYVKINDKFKDVCLVKKVEPVFPYFGYDVYGVESGGVDIYAFYYCSKCCKFLVGMPNIFDFNSDGLLSGVSGHDFFAGIVMFF